MSSFDIDLIYLWVDGNDPEWQKKKQAFTNVVTDNSEMNNKGRFANNNELIYSLRSVEKYAPWIRRIFIVTDNQVPGWLNTAHPKITIIDHKDIIPAEILPLYNSSVIEYFLYKIPGLAEHFLFANDDMFLNASISPDFFFKESKPIVRLKRKRFDKLSYRLKDWLGKQLGQYRDKVHRGALAVEKITGKYYGGMPHHNIDAYRKSDYQKTVEEIFSDQVKNSQTHRLRTYGDMHRSAFSLYALAIGHAHLRYVRRYESMRISIHRYDFINYLNKYKPELFCLNDSQEANPKHREKVVPFLEQIFTHKSAFEK
jgi:hypothetical protein